MAMTLAFGPLSVLFVLFLFGLPVALMVALQVWLCRKSLKLGLILPCVSLALSLLLTLAVVLNMADAGSRVLLAIGLMFLITNIPTIVYGGIWLHCKGRRDTLEDLKKMRIEDLE